MIIAFIKNKLEESFKNKIESLKDKLFQTENEVEVLHLKNVRLQNKYILKSKK